MNKQEFLSELERALGKLPHAEVEQALAFYDEAISDRMEDGLSEAEAVADLGPIDEIAAQIAAETPPILAPSPARTPAAAPSTSCCSPRSLPSGYPSCSRSRRPRSPCTSQSGRSSPRCGPSTRSSCSCPSRGLPHSPRPWAGACRCPACSYSASRSCRAASDSSPPSPCSGPANCSSGQRVPSRAGSRACSCACPVKTMTARRPIG